MNLPVYKPYLPPEAVKYAYEAIDSGWISKGKYLDIVQEKLQNLLGVKHVLLVSSGTGATHLLSKALQFKGISDIVVPNNVYVVAWNAFLFDQKHILHSVDANIDSWNFDLKLLDAKLALNQNVAILAVHNLGNIINVPELKRKYPNTTIVEDNCEGFLGKYEGKYSGTESLASSISFFANKNITSAEGGAFVTNSSDIYEHAKCIRGQGQSDKKFVHNILGTNYRMTNIQAGLLLGQLEMIDEVVEKKSAIFAKYKNCFEDAEGIELQQSCLNTQKSNWMFAVRVVGNKGCSGLISFLKQKNIESRPMFHPMSSHNHIQHNKNVNIGSEDIAKKINNECIVLPSYPELKQDEIEYISNCVKSYMKLQ